MVTEQLSLLPTSIVPDSQFYYRRGFKYQELGEYQKALHEFTTAINIDPEIPEYYYYRGLIYQQLDNYAEALSDETKAANLFENQGHYYGYKQSQKVISILKN